MQSQLQNNVVLIFQRHMSFKKHNKHSTQTHTMYYEQRVSLFVICRQSKDGGSSYATPI